MGVIMKRIITYSLLIVALSGILLSSAEETPVATPSERIKPVSEQTDASEVASSTQTTEFRDKAPHRSELSSSQPQQSSQTSILNAQTATSAASETSSVSESTSLLTVRPSSSEAGATEFSSDFNHPYNRASDSPSPTSVSNEQNVSYESELQAAGTDVAFAPSSTMDAKSLKLLKKPDDYVLLSEPQARRSSESTSENTFSSVAVATGVNSRSPESFNETPSKVADREKSHFGESSKPVNAVERSRLNGDVKIAASEALVQDQRMHPTSSDTKSSTSEASATENDSLQMKESTNREPTTTNKPSEETVGYMAISSANALPEKSLNASIFVENKEETSSKVLVSQVTSEALTTELPTSLQAIHVNPKHLTASEETANAGNMTTLDISEYLSKNDKEVEEKSSEALTFLPGLEKDSVLSSGNSSTWSNTPAKHNEKESSRLASELFSSRIGYISEPDDGINSLSEEVGNPVMTFDPNGMTNNGPQDPDSVTFSVINSDVNGMSPGQHFANVFDTIAITEPNVKPDYEIEMMHSPDYEKNDEREREKDISNEFISEGPRIIISSEAAVLEDEIRNSSSQSFKEKVELVTIPTTLKINSSFFVGIDKEEEMMNDSPYTRFSDNTQSNPPTSYSITRPRADTEATPKPGVNDDESVVISISETTISSLASFINHSIEPHTEQSVIRPVKITFENESTSHAPVFFTQDLDSAALPKDAKSSPNSAIPDTLPDSSPSTTNQSSELVTVLSRPELETVGTNESAIELPHSRTNDSNSTIAGVAVKTSVSVSLPLSKGSNISQQSSEDGRNVSTTDVIKAPEEPLPVSPVSVVFNPTPSASKIRKPILRIGGRNESNTTERTRKPFVFAPKRPSTTTGSPVSLFGKSRSRRPSITSSTTAASLPSAYRVLHYASRGPPGVLPELVSSRELVTTTIATTTTTTEEPYSEEPFTDQTVVPTVSREDDVTLIKVGGYIVLERGIRWDDQLRIRHSPLYKEKSDLVHLQLERLFRTSPIATRLWKIEIDGFSRINDTRPVAVDFILYLIKSGEDLPAEQLIRVFHDKLKNGTFSRFRVDTTKTNFEVIHEEPLKKPTPPPENPTGEPPIPQWAIAVIVIGAASLIFVVLFATVTMYGRHHMRRRYSHKLNEEDSDHRTSDWESKMAAAYENLAADCIYDADDMRGDYPRKGRMATFHGRPSKLERHDSWSAGSNLSTLPRKQRPPLHGIIF